MLKNKESIMNRRNFNKILLGATALSLAASTGLANMAIPKNKKRVVIVGGGFGGR